MNTLLIFFAFPIAVIIFSIILQRLLHSPFAVAAIIFAIFIIVTFAAFDETFLIATLAYTILAFVTAVLVDRLRNNNNYNGKCCNQNVDSVTCLCNALTEALENSNNSTNNVIDGLLDLLHNNTDNNTNDDTNTCNAQNTTTVPNDDNVISNNCGYMYNRRCRKF